MPEQRPAAPPRAEEFLDPGERPPPRVQRVILLASVFTVAACGLVYELIAGAISSYLLGDAVTQFSLVIGVFLCAMGLGSFLAKLVTHDLLRAFVEVQIAIGVIGGTSSIAMFAINAFAAPVFPPLFYTLVAVIGALVGVEIPLLVRILRTGSGISEAISHVLALDYLGALVGSVLFPLVALPFIGLSRTSVVFGLMNLAVAGAGIGLLRERRGGIASRLAVAAVLLVAALAGSNRMVGFLEDLMYQDSIVLTRQTAYQRIVLTRWRDDLRLYLNGHIQLSSIDEARYHEALVQPAMAAVPGARQVLILGGGDGLAAREVLKHAAVTAVTLVDIDPEMTGLARTRPELVALNQGSLSSPRVEVVNTDAMGFLESSRQSFDVIVIDLPDPSTPALAKLYSTAFYALATRRLAADGVLVTQATSPFQAPQAFWCIVETIASAIRSDPQVPGLEPLPYHLHVPSFGEWGFVMAARQRIEPAALSVAVPTRFLTDETLRAMFAFGADMPPSAVEANRLDDPVLHRYYEAGWRAFNE